MNSMLQPRSTDVNDVVCGDVFLSSFEWATCASKDSYSGSSQTQGNASPISDDNSIDNSTHSPKIEQLVGKQQLLPPSRPVNSIEEIPRSIKRPVSYISASAESNSPLLRNKKYFCECIEKDSKSSWSFRSNRLEDIIQNASGNQDHRVMITSASFPYHVEWVSSSWSKLCGWHCHEILGEWSS